MPRALCCAVVFLPFSVRALRCNCLISFELFRSVRLHNTFGFLILSHFDSLCLPFFFFLPHWQVWAQLIPIESWLARLVKWHFVQSHTTAPVQHILLFVLCCCRAFPADLYEKHDNCSWWIYDWSRTSRREFQEEYLQTYFFPFTIALVCRQFCVLLLFSIFIDVACLLIATSPADIFSYSENLIRDMGRWEGNKNGNCVQHTPIST